MTYKDFIAKHGVMPTPARSLAVGDVIHGFAHGLFGRDHYGCCAVEGIGPDWAVFRGIGNGPEPGRDQDAWYGPGSGREQDVWYGDLERGSVSLLRGGDFSAVIAERDNPDFGHCGHGGEA